LAIKISTVVDDYQAINKFLINEARKLIGFKKRDGIMIQGKIESSDGYVRCANKNCRKLTERSRALLIKSKRRTSGKMITVYVCNEKCKEEYYRK